MFFSPCPRGLESVLATELEHLTAQDITIVPGGVQFRGEWPLCYRVNLESRIASRMLWIIYSGPYRHEEDIYRSTYEQPWPKWFPVHCRIKVKVKGSQCPLRSMNFVTLRIKDAVCDKFAHVVGSRPSIETRSPDIQIHAYLDRQHFTLHLDTSGEPLFKRGLRKAQGQAPLRENLAAGMLHLAGWTPEQPLVDPMCGSGTILMEAAQMARRIAPGLGRRFAFEHFFHFDSHAWKALCQSSRARQLPPPPVTLFGYDCHRSSLEAAHINLQAAGLADSVSLQQSDILTITAPADHGVLLTNPPYGIRSGERDTLTALYPQMGDRLKQHFPNWRAHFLTADFRLPKLIGLAASRRTPLYNGDLECRLFEFKMVRGGNRKSARQRPVVANP